MILRGIVGLYYMHQWDAGPPRWWRLSCRCAVGVGIASFRPWQSWAAGARSGAPLFCLAGGHGPLGPASHGILFTNVVCFQRGSLGLRRSAWRPPRLKAAPPHKFHSPRETWRLWFNGKFWVAIANKAAVSAKVGKEESVTDDAIPQRFLDNDTRIGRQAFLVLPGLRAPIGAPSPLSLISTVVRCSGRQICGKETHWVHAKRTLFSAGVCVLRHVVVPQTSVV